MSIAALQVGQVGRRVEVWWQRQESWFAGRIDGYSTETGAHTIKFDDGDIHALVLTQEKVNWLGF